METSLRINNLSYNPETKTFFNGTVPTTDVVRYLKGLYTNIGRFKERYVKQIDNFLKTHETDPKVEAEMRETFGIDTLIDDLVTIYPKVKPFSYKEAFEIKDAAFKALVFGSINIGEMIETLGHKRIKTEGIAVKHKNFVNGEFVGYKEYDNVYEVHEVDGKALGADSKLYVLKCWCTSTNKEHFIWIDEKYKDKPLEAVASTFVIHENLIPHIKEIKRQGDILLVEMKEDIEPKGDKVSLTAEQYFGLLTVQS